jgi:hypothetical protein
MLSEQRPAMARPSAGAPAYIVLFFPNGNLPEAFARESSLGIPMDEIDRSSKSRRGLRFVVFAALLCAYLISSILPVSTYMNGAGNSEYLYGHHAFVYNLTGKKSDRERPQQWGVLANFAFLVGMTMLFHGEWLGAAAAGAVATYLAIVCFIIGPGEIRPCLPTDVFLGPGFGGRNWKSLPRADGPFLIGYYVWLVTLASLSAVGVMGMFTSRSNDGLDESGSTPRI